MKTSKNIFKEQKTVLNRLRAKDSVKEIKSKRQCEKTFPDSFKVFRSHFETASSQDLDMQASVAATEEPPWRRPYAPPWRQPTTWQPRKQWQWVEAMKNQPRKQWQRQTRAKKKPEPKHEKNIRGSVGVQMASTYIRQGGDSRSVVEDVEKTTPKSSTLCLSSCKRRRIKRGRRRRKSVSSLE